MYAHLDIGTLFLPLVRLPEAKRGAGRAVMEMKANCKNVINRPVQR